MSLDDVGRGAASGSVILAFGNFVSAAILAVAAIAAARILGPDSYGIFTISMALALLLQVFAGFGTGQAITRFTALFLSTGEREKAARLNKNALVFVTVASAGFTLLSYLVARIYSTIFLARANITPFVQLSSILIIGIEFAQVSQASLAGQNRMKLVTASNVAQAAIKLVLVILLLTSGFGVNGAILATAISYLGVGIIGMLFALQGLGRSPKGGLREDVRRMLRFGGPIYGGTVVSGFATQYVTVILALVSTNALLGYYGAASNITVAITFVSSAIGVTLAPAFATIHGRGGDLQSSFSHALRYTSYLMTPVTALVIIASGPLVLLFYGATYLPGVLMLRLLCLAYLPYVMVYSVVIPFTNGIGRTRVTMIMMVGSAVSVGVLTPLLAISASLGIIGLIYAGGLSNLVMAIVGLLLLRRADGIRADLGSVGRVLLAGLAAVVISVFPFAPASAFGAYVVVEMAVFVLAYLILLPSVGAIRRDDVSRLLNSSSSLGLLRPIVRLILLFESKVLEFVSGSRGR